MKITVKRVATNADETYGLMTVDGELFCHTLEDAHHLVKIPDKTCIPAGEYKVGVRPVSDGKVNARYKKKFEVMHRGMLWLQDVPGFTWIYIHMGNTHKHTSGCILVAAQCLIGEDGNIVVQRSESAYTRLYRHVIDAAESGDLTIEVIDNDN